MNEIKIANYTLTGSDTVIVEYPDGHKIDLGKINPIQVGIIKEDGKWIVNIITKESIMKLANNITQNLDLIGFPFNKLDDAVTAHIFLVNELLNKSS